MSYSNYSKSHEFSSEEEYLSLQSTQSMDKEVISELIDFVARTLDKRLNKIEKLIKKNKKSFSRAQREFKHTKNKTDILLEEQNRANSYVPISDEIKRMFSKVKERKRSEKSVSRNTTRKSVSRDSRGSCCRCSQQENTSPLNKNLRRQPRGSKRQRSRSLQRASPSSEKAWDRLYNLGVEKYGPESQRKKEEIQNERYEQFKLGNSVDKRRRRGSVSKRPPRKSLKREEPRQRKNTESTHRNTHEDSECNSIERLDEDCKNLIKKSLNLPFLKEDGFFEEINQAKVQKTEERRNSFSSLVVESPLEEEPKDHTMDFAKDFLKKIANCIPKKPDSDPDDQGFLKDSIPTESQETETQNQHCIEQQLIDDDDDDGQDFSEPPPLMEYKESVKDSKNKSFGSQVFTNDIKAVHNQMGSQLDIEQDNFASFGGPQKMKKETFSRQQILSRIENIEKQVYSPPN